MHSVHTAVSLSNMPTPLCLGGWTEEEEGDAEEEEILNSGSTPKQDSRSSY